MTTTSESSMGTLFIHSLPVLDDTMQPGAGSGGAMSSGDQALACVLASEIQLGTTLEPATRVGHRLLLMRVSWCAWSQNSRSGCWAAHEW